MAVPYTFGTATSSIPLSQLDSNFATVITLGNTATQLGNTVTTLNNMTLANVTISSGNITLTNVSATTANVTTANITTAVIGTETVTTSTITTANVTTANITTANITTGTVITSLTLSYGTANGVTYLNGSKVLTSGSALTFDGTTFQYTGAANFATSTGNVGVGTTSPVNYAGFGYGPTIEAFGGRGGSFVTTSASSTVRGVFSADSSAPVVNLKTVTNHSLAFGVNDAEQMRLTSTGLGIGTSSPSEKLDVSGNGKFTLPSSVGSINLRQSSTTSTELHIRPNSGKNGWISFTEDAVADRWIIGVKTGNGSLFFNTGSVGSNTDRMVLDTSGNLGLGVTPSAWQGSPINAMQIGSAMSLSGYSTSTNRQANIWCNAYVNGSGVTTYVNSDAASAYRQLTGTHAWYIAPSGTAGSAISFTQAMTLDASGNLLCGVTSATNFPSQGITLMQNTNVGSIGIGHASGTSSGNGYLQFNYNGSSIGSVTQSGTTAVLYNVTSDYRLKNNPIPLTGSGEFIDALLPKTWDWWDGSGKGVGFIAHEFMKVAKYSGNGEKDAVDADGKPVYQSIQPSSSEVMAYLVAEIQSLRKRLTALEST